MLSYTSVSVTLGRDSGDAATVLKSGLTVTLRANGVFGTLLLIDGEIIDDGTVYNHVGRVLGNFNCKNAPSV